MSNPRSKTKERNWSPIRLPGDDDRSTKDVRDRLFPSRTILALAWDLQQCGMCDQQSLRSAFEYAQSDPSLCWWLEYSMSVKLLTEHNLECLSLNGGCTGSSESTLAKMPHCWKSHVVTYLK